VAQSRDLSDRKTIENFAAVAQSLERLKLLTIMTTADIRAVGPGVWNGWKAQLLRTLYYETEPVLTGGFSEVNRAQRVAAAHVGPLARQRGLWQLVEHGVERPDGDPVIRRGFQQLLGLVTQLLGVLPGAFGQHAGDRSAPTPANLFQVGEFGYVNGHRLLPNSQQLPVLRGAAARLATS